MAEYEDYGELDDLRSGIWRIRPEQSEMENAAANDDHEPAGTRSIAT